MKKIFFLFFMAVATNAIAQNKNYILSTDGIGPIKMGMTLADLEKLLQTKITLKVIDVDPVVLVETIKAKYKGIDLEIDLIKMQGIPAAFVSVDGMSTSSPLCKTNSGIGIGSTKIQIINAYEGYHVDARPVFTEDDPPKKSKTRSTVTVKEAAEGYAILFHLVNNKVVSFQLFADFDDEE